MSTDFPDQVIVGDPTTSGDVSIWLRQEPSKRRPRLSRDDIARAAVRIADAEGIEAVSMRRVAAELGAGTMTLYHYIDTKADLFALITDAVIGENLVPDDEFPEDWRAAIIAIATRTRAALSRHPWIFDVIDQPGIGPNGVRHFEQSIQAVAGLPIDLVAKLDIVGAVDEYVFGYCLRENQTLSPADGTQMYRAGMFDYLATMIATGDFPHFATMVEEMGMDAVWSEVTAHAADTDRFERNLVRLVDGIARDVVPD